MDDLTCEDCGKIGPEISLVFCPFAYDIHDELVPVVLCPDCEQDRADDI